MSSVKPTLFSQDDRMLEGAGRQVTAEVNRFFSKKRLEQGERLRLARELHDGVLQSLAGTALQLEALSCLMEADPEAAQGRLRVIQELIAEEQRELRGWIEKAQPSTPESIATGADLSAALEKLRERAEWQWGLRIELAVDGRGTVPRKLGDEIYRIVQEALTNAGRHAHARVVRVSIELDPGSEHVYITVSDDGCGFPLHGRFDLAEMATRLIGPRSLRERVASLGGELGLSSELSGSRLEICLPVAKHSARRPAQNFTSA